MKTVGERIRQARELRRISGEELARLVGYGHQSAIGNLENRATGTGGRKIGEIAKALQVPLAWLLEGPDCEVVPELPPISDEKELRSTSQNHRIAEENNNSYALLAELTSVFLELTNDTQLQVVKYVKFLAADEAPNPHRAPRKDNSLSNKKAA